MYAATVTPAGTATALRALINAATANQINDGYNGRAFEVILQWVSGTVDVNWKSGTVGAADSGFQLSTTDRSLTLRAPVHNQLSIDDIYLSGATSPSARVIINIV